MRSNTASTCVFACLISNPPSCLLMNWATPEFDCQGADSLRHFYVRSLQTCLRYLTPEFDWIHISRFPTNIQTTQGSFLSCKCGVSRPNNDRPRLLDIFLDNEGWRGRTSNSNRALCLVVCLARKAEKEEKAWVKLLVSQFPSRFLLPEGFSVPSSRCLPSRNGIRR